MKPNYKELPTKIKVLIFVICALLLFALGGMSIQSYVCRLQNSSCFDVLSLKERGFSWDEHEETKPVYDFITVSELPNSIITEESYLQKNTAIVLVYYPQGNESKRIIKMNMSMCGFKNEFTEVECVS